MNPAQTGTALLAAIEARRPVFLWGQPGIGKSSIVYDVAKVQGRALVDVRLSQMEPVDLRGLPVPDLSQKATRWLPPVWLPAVGSNHPASGILFLDEASSAPPSVQAAVYQLVLDRRLGEAELLPDWQIVLAGNRVTDGGVAFRLATPLANRMIHLEVESDLATWSDWAARSGIHEWVLAFIRFRPALLNTFDAALKTREAAFATPRSWHMVSDLLKIEPEAAIRPFLLTGAVGQGAAAEFEAFVRMMDALPDIDAILSGKAVPVPREIGIKYAAVTTLALRVNNTNFPQALRWCDNLGAEFCVLFVSFVRQRQPVLLKDKAFIAWVRGHKEVLL